MAKIASIICMSLVVVGLIQTASCALNIIDIYRNVVFDYAVMKNPKPVVVFYFSTSSCTPCLWSIKPMLEKMAKRKSDKLFLAFVDLDKVPDLEKKHGITTIPTTRVLYKGEVVDSVEGLSWSQLTKLVNNAAKIITKQ